MRKTLAKHRKKEKPIRKTDRNEIVNDNIRKNPTRNTSQKSVPLLWFYISQRKCVVSEIRRLPLWTPIHWPTSLDQMIIEKLIIWLDVVETENASFIENWTRNTLFQCVFLWYFHSFPQNYFVSEISRLPLWTPSPFLAMILSDSTMIVRTKYHRPLNALPDP